MCSLQEHSQRSDRERLAQQKEPIYTELAAEYGVEYEPPTDHEEIRTQSGDLIRHDLIPVDVEESTGNELQEAQADAWIDGAASVMVKHEIHSHDAQNPYRSQP